MLHENMNLSRNNTKESLDNTNDRDSSVSSTSINETDSPSISNIEYLTDRASEVLIGRFSQIDFSEKNNRKVINWLITTSWVNNLDSECLYQAIVLYYCYKANRKINKSKLQLLLVTLLYISSKKNRGTKLSIGETQELCKKRYESQDIVEMEAQVLQLMDYNLQFDLALSQLLWSRQIQDQTLNKLLFLNEVSLFDSCQVFFSKKKLFSLLKFIEKSDSEFGEWQYYCSILKLQEVQILLKKYSSKFNMPQFLKIFNKKME